ncbi:SIR2 family protein [Clostridium botulinum]|nr:SIR2 family protein [Clostridium botulinum]
MSNNNFIRELQKIYNEGNLIPFIGAGLSIPFNIPDWGKLIRDCALYFGIEDVNGKSLIGILDINLEEYDYWESVRIIKKYLHRSDEDIQEYIANSIRENVKYEIDDSLHNYKDLAKCDFNIYITTNYDHILNKYLNSSFIPMNLKDFNDNTQKLITQSKDKRILHLHGNITDMSSIVISEKKYRELYECGEYNKLFSLFIGTKTFIFMGFSFNDVFIQKIIKDNNEFFKSKHYIVLANPSTENIKWLKEQYNLETIAYNSENSSHSEEIRKILNKICLKNEESGEMVSSIYANEIVEDLLDILPTNAKKKELEKNLFCKKLRLEKIGELKIDYSKDCFFTAEQYFRWLKKSGIKNNDIIANHLLDLSYMKYKELLINEFYGNKDSDSLLKFVHASLSKLEYSKLKNKINDENMPNDINKQGFIHVLADNSDTEKQVWWGDERFE